MSRPKKCRKIGYSPDYYTFKPASIPGKELEEIILSVDEFEAIRLADLEEMYQEKAAEKMDISRQTFGNIVSSARKKIADAIVNGKMIRIKGGNVTFTEKRNFYCEKCKNIWEAPFGTAKPLKCPACESSTITRK